MMKKKNVVKMRGGGGAKKKNVVKKRGGGMIKNAWRWFYKRKPS